MGTHYVGTEGEVRALNCLIKFTRAGNSLQSWLNRAIAAYGLTESQFGTLEAIYHLGPLCQHEIAHKLLCSPGNLTTVINNLEQRGLVRRERDAHDRRQVSVHLTEAGHSLIASIFPQHVALIVDMMSVLSPEEQEILSSLSKRLGSQQR